MLHLIKLLDSYSTVEKVRDQPFPQVQGIVIVCLNGTGTEMNLV